jgi:hypothetical protein
LSDAIRGIEQLQANAMITDPLVQGGQHLQRAVLQGFHFWQIEYNRTRVPLGYNGVTKGEYSVGLNESAVWLKDCNITYCVQKYVEHSFASRNQICRAYRPLMIVGLRADDIYERNCHGAPSEPFCRITTRLIRRNFGTGTLKSTILASNRSRVFCAD